ncbi:hypothetical protein HT136_13090 [Novosphingobium profundi]|uniref:hypothetical protein n=1 Tax=Novosphingobium profundi TaxID=1774954 RepID=UPI001BDB5A75|nr:hypothetical protein [Novosphingobium profundi]MBT0669300.1 hypothetical protein [Novosphingobium profundi]
MFARPIAALIALAVLPAQPALAAGNGPHGAPDRAVVALGALSAADLGVTSPRGKAFLDLLHPGHPEACGPNESDVLDFERSCMWSAREADDDFDMLLGIDQAHIVSVVTAWPDRLPASLWDCQPVFADDAAGGLMACGVRSASDAQRRHWAQSWRAFLQSAS